MGQVSLHEQYAAHKSTSVAIGSWLGGAAFALQLHAAVEANHFGVMQVHNLKETMTREGRGV